MIILGWISIILIACTLLCGLWMLFSSGEKDAKFHAIFQLTMLTTLI